MRVVVYTKRGEVLHQFSKVDEIREYESYYEVIFKDDTPWARIYGKGQVILIKSYGGMI